MSGTIFTKIEDAIHPERRPQGTTAQGAAVNPAPSTTTAAPGLASNTAGPHRHNIMNKIDPQVDSRGVPSNTGAAPGKANFNAGGAVPAGTAAPGMSGTGANVPEGTYGPHSSRLANALDPRVDSDRDGSQQQGPGYQGNAPAATAGAGGAASGPGGMAGGQQQRLPNQGYNTAGTLGGGATAAAGSGLAGGEPGPAPNTAGPHRHDILNKLDPSVDSNPQGGAGATYPAPRNY